MRCRRRCMQHDMRWVDGLTHEQGRTHAAMHVLFATADLGGWHCLCYLIAVALS